MSLYFLNIIYNVTDAESNAELGLVLTYKERVFRKEKATSAFFFFSVGKNAESPIKA